jgi:chromosome segregation ATPase
LSTSSSASDEFDKEIVELNSEFEYIKLHDLLNTVLYYDKLLFQYRYDSKKDQWNTTRFPVTRTDKHIEEIKSDIDSAQKAVEEYNRNLEYLTRKYNININEEDGIFLPLP